MYLILRFIASAAALYVTVLVGKALGLGLYLDPGTHGLVACAIAAVVLGVVNAVIRPIVELIALPLTCLTLGLFSVVINAILFWVVGQIVPGFHVKGFLASLFGTIVMSFVGGILNFLVVSQAEKGRG